MKILKLKTINTERILMIGNSEEIKIHGMDLIEHGYLVILIENFKETDNEKFFGLLINPDNNVRLVNADHILSIYFDPDIVKETINILEFSPNVKEGKFIWKNLQYITGIAFNNDRSYSRTFLYSDTDKEFVKQQYEKINNNTGGMKSSLGNLTYEFYNQLTEDGKVFTSYIEKSDKFNPTPIKYGADFLVSEIIMNDYTVAITDIEFKKFGLSNYTFNYDIIRDFCGKFHGSKKKNEQLLYVLPDAVNELAKKISNREEDSIFDDVKKIIVALIMSGSFMNYRANLDVKAAIVDNLLYNRTLSDDEVAGIVDYFYVDQISVELEIIANELIKKL